MVKDKFFEMTFVKGGILSHRGRYKRDKSSLTKEEISEAERVELRDERERLEELLDRVDINAEEEDSEGKKVKTWRYAIERLEDIRKNRAEVGEEYNLEISIPIRSFYIATYLITQEQWEEIMDENNSAFKGRMRPVENVTWLETIEFCNRLSKKKGLNPAYKITEEKVIFIESANGYRLPSFIQWNYACEGGRKNDSNYRDKISYLGIGWYEEDFDPEDFNFKAYFIKKGTQPVGKKKPNELGIYDMLGNVREWCWDRKWTYEYAFSVSNSIKNKVKMPEPSGPDYGDCIYTMGGSWDTDHFYLADGYRLVEKPQSYCNDLGFRVVLPENYKDR